MIKINEQNKEYTYKNASKMPFVYEGLNTSDSNILYLKIKTDCSCTDVDVYLANTSTLTKVIKPFVKTNSVGPSTIFYIKGSLKKRKKLGLHTKKITISIYDKDFTLPINKHNTPIDKIDLELEMTLK